jgi:hypothetical protein
MPGAGSEVFVQLLQVILSQHTSFLVLNLLIMFRRVCISIPTPFLYRVYTYYIILKTPLSRYHLTD